MADEQLIERVETLGRRVNGLPENVPEVLPQLLALLREHSDDPTALVAIIMAINVAWDEQGSLALLPYVDHPDSVVRLEVTRGLYGGVESTAAQNKMAEALIQLSRDESDEVRDWATFALGRQLQVDTSEVRDALFARVTDPYEEVRDEALFGLAWVRDPRALAILRDRLENDFRVEPLVWKAVEYVAHPELIDIIGRWLVLDPDPDAVAAALRACDPFVRAERFDRQTELLAAIERLVEEGGFDARVAMYCDRFSTDVLLSGDTDSSIVSWVDGLLEHNGNDPERAALDYVARMDS